MGTRANPQLENPISMALATPVKAPADILAMAQLISLDVWL